MIPVAGKKEQFPALLSKKRKAPADERAEASKKPTIEPAVDPFTEMELDDDNEEDQEENARGYTPIRLGKFHQLLSTEPKNEKSCSTICESPT